MSLKSLLELLAERPLLRRKDVARHFGISLRSVDRWVTEKKLPRPIYVHGPMWRPADIERIEMNNESTKTI
jgi:predicted DNA-binding transcriptional regulator AlpA